MVKSEAFYQKQTGEQEEQVRIQLIKEEDDNIRKHNIDIEQWRLDEEKRVKERLDREAS